MVFLHLDIPKWIMDIIRNAFAFVYLLSSGLTLCLRLLLLPIVSWGRFLFCMSSSIIFELLEPLSFERHVIFFPANFDGLLFAFV